MKKNFTILLVTILFVVGLVIVGCKRNSKPYVEMTQDTIKQLKVSNVESIYVVQTAGDKDSKNWIKVLEEVFPICDPNRKNIIISCMREANPVERFGMNNLVFETANTRFFTSIGFDDKEAYGKWGESSELLDYLHQWGLEFDKGEPNLPTGPILSQEPNDFNEIRYPFYDELNKK